MLDAKALRLGCAVAFGLTIASTTSAATLYINDLIPNQLTLTHQGFDFGGSTNGAPLTPGGGVTVSGEMATFHGVWNSTAPVEYAGGVIYFVDPAQTDLVRAVVYGEWGLANPMRIGMPPQEITLMIESSEFGENLGLLPLAFKGKGVPLKETSGPVQGLFRNPETAMPAPFPGGLSIHFNIDEQPETPHEPMYSQEPDYLNAWACDMDNHGGGAYEMAESIQFSEDVVIRSLRWWGVYSGAHTVRADADEFFLEVYEPAGGSPYPTPVSTFHLYNTVRAGTEKMIGTMTNLPVFVYVAELPAPLTLKANTMYYFSIMNRTTKDVDDGWYWCSSSIGDNTHWVRVPPMTGLWVGYTDDMAYELCGNLAALDCQSDMDKNGMVNGVDLALMLAHWGACGPPIPVAYTGGDTGGTVPMPLNPKDDPTEMTVMQR